METSYLKTLELDKIIARAAEGCVCKESREKLLAIEPQCDPDEVRYALEQTDAINSLLIKNGSPRFGGVEGHSLLSFNPLNGLHSPLLIPRTILIFVPQGTTQKIGGHCNEKEFYV